MNFIGFYNYTVILTYISLVSSLVGIKCAYEGKFTMAIFCLAASGICDMFDGAVARSKKNRTADEKNFGIQIDSLCDVICFGVFPAVFLYFIETDTILGFAILACYVLCALIRLAFFNVLETKRQKSESGCAKGYRGLPVTSISIILPIVYFFDVLFIPSNVMHVVYYIVPFLVGLLFITDFFVPKLDVSKLFRKTCESEEEKEEVVCYEE